MPALLEAVPHTVAIKMSVKRTKKLSRSSKDGGRDDSARGASQEPAKAASDGPAPAGAGGAPQTATLAAAVNAQEQSRLFEEGIALFQAREFRRARECFAQAALGPVREIAHAARLRVLICERRLSTAEPRLETAEDHYNYAIALMNERRWEEAEKYLDRALAQNPKGDHLYYALALCRGSRGDLEGACNFMKRAIELQPRNLVAARNDPDFAQFSQQPPLSELLNPDKSPSL